MHDIFEPAADLLMRLLGIDEASSLGKAFHFLFNDGLEIFVMLYFVIFLISVVRKHINPLKLRDYIGGKNRLTAYVAAAALGCPSPFCSCSGIPMFLGFVGAGVPLGVCAAFLLAAATVNEIGMVLLISVAGIKITVLYVGIGMVIAVIGGYLVDRFNLKKGLRSGAVLFEETHHCNGHEHNHEHCDCGHEIREQMSTWHYAHHFAVQSIKETWVYILCGVILGAVVQGFVPDDVLLKVTRAENWWSVPVASVAGALLYAPHGAVIPIFGVLLQKGVPLGTAMTILMSTAAISLPALAMLKKVLSFKMLLWLIVYMLVAFNIAGFTLNYFS